MASENRAVKLTVNGHLNQTTVHYELLQDVIFLRGEWYSLFIMHSFTSRPYVGGFPQKGEKRT